MKKIYIIILFTFILITTACSSKTKPINPEAEYYRGVFDTCFNLAVNNGKNTFEADQLCNAVVQDAVNAKWYEIESSGFIFKKEYPNNPNG